MVKMEPDAYSMNFDADVVFVVVECLAKAKRPVTQAEIIDEVPFDRRSVAGIVFALFSCGFLHRELSGNSTVGSAGEQDYMLSITKNVTAYHIIKLGELGLDMASLLSLVKVSEKQKQAAMALAMQTEKLAELDGKARAKRAESMAKQTNSTPPLRDAIVDTLERLAQASEMSINEVKGVRGSEDILRALVDAKEQAMKALVKYQDQLGKSGPDHIGF